MINITVKLYASLANHLPPTAKRNQFDMALEREMTVAEVFQSLGVPEAMCHLVLINGNFVAIDDRTSVALTDGDHLAAWPPVAGG